MSLHFNSFMFLCMCNLSMLGSMVSQWSATWRKAPHCHLELPRRAPHLTSYLNNTIKDDQFADVLRVWLVHVHFPKTLILQGRARARPVLCLLVRCFTKGLGKRHPCVYVLVRVVCVQHGWWIGVISGYRVVILLPRQTAALMSGAGVS